MPSLANNATSRANGTTAHLEMSAYAIFLFFFVDSAYKASPKKPPSPFSVISTGIHKQKFLSENACTTSPSMRTTAALAYSRAMGSLRYGTNEPS